MVFHFLHEVFELLVFLVPLVDGRQQVLALHLAAHDEKVVAEVVQLVAGTVGPVLQEQHEPLQLLLLNGPQFQGLLLLGDNLLVAILLLHLSDFHPQCWDEEGEAEREGEGEEEKAFRTQLFTGNNSPPSPTGREHNDAGHCTTEL